jgi:trigger factor
MIFRARVAELVDALDLGSSSGDRVGVQVSPLAPFKADVSSKLIQSAFIDALKETELNIVGSPKVDPPELDAGAAYLFDAEVEINPEIPDIAFKGLELNKTKYEATEEEVGVQLKVLQKNLTQREKITEERPIRENDVAVIDYEGFRNGEPFEPTKKTENFTMKVGEGLIVKDLDDGLIGMSVNAEKEIEVAFPEDYYKEEMAGQQLVFKVKLNEIREEVVPDLDDAFAKSISDKFETLEILKEKIRENLLEGYRKRTEQELNEQIFQQLLEKCEFEVPDTLVDSELAHIISDAERSFEQSNKSFEDVGLTKEGLEEQYRPTAERQVRRHLILNKLIDQEKLELSDEELDQGFKEMADIYQQPVEHLKGYYQQNKDGLAYFKHTLLEKKVLKLIIESGQITEVEPAKTEEAEER